MPGDELMGREKFDAGRDLWILMDEENSKVCCRPRRSKVVVV